VANPVSQPSLDISPVWFPIISKEVGKLQSDLTEVILMFFGHKIVVQFLGTDTFYLLHLIFDICSLYALTKTTVVWRLR
jgi:hypothetical protein